MPHHVEALPATLVVILLATSLPLHGSLAAATEQVCIKAKQATYTGETIACYSDAGCKYAATMGGEPIRDYDVASAPYALARGKIAAIVTSSPGLAKKVREVGGRCTPVRL